MKRLVIALLLLLLLLSGGCVKKRVLLPLPYTFDQLLPIVTTSGRFDEFLVLDAKTIVDQINDLLQDQMKLNNIIIEGFAYTVELTNSPSTVLNASIDVGNTLTDSPTNLLVIDGKVLGDILNEPQRKDLQREGIELIQTTMQEVIFQHVAKNIIFHLQGTVNPVPADGLILNLRLQLTVSAVAEQCQEVFDLFGSDDDRCN